MNFIFYRSFFSIFLRKVPNFIPLGIAFDLFEFLEKLISAIFSQVAESGCHWLPDCRFFGFRT